MTTDEMMMYAAINRSKDGALTREHSVFPDRMNNVRKFADSIIEAAKTERLSISELRAACATAVNEAENWTLVYGRTLMEAALDMASDILTCGTDCQKEDAAKSLYGVVTNIRHVRRELNDTLDKIEDGVIVENVGGKGKKATQ